VLGELAGNVSAHADAVRAAAARVVVFPELSLTGYDVDASPVVDPGDGRLGPLIDACAATGSVALAGAPVRDQAGHQYIATLAVTSAGAAVAYRKMYLGADERRRFQAGGRPSVHVVDGWRIGLAICKDTSVQDHAEATAGHAIDVYAAGLVMHAHEAAEQYARGRRIAGELGAYVAFASFAGATGSGYAETAGRSAIWDRNGTALAQAGPAPTDIARAELR
jgi:predicted amidohydrolase